MADFTALKNSIQTYIKQNGNEEITGNILQEVLLSMVQTMGDGAINDLVTALSNEVTNRQNADGTLQNNINAEALVRGNADTALGGRLTTVEGAITAINTKLSEGYVYAGIATPSTNPGSISGKVFYIAVQAGTYTNFGGTAVTEGITILKYNGTSWVKEQALFTDGGVFDISAYNNDTYDDLSDALSGTNVPTNVRKGGMSVKFVQSSDNKYVQFRYMEADATTAATFTNIANWQGVDIAPTYNSRNLPESRGTHIQIEPIRFEVEGGKNYIDNYVIVADGNLASNENFSVSNFIKIESDWFDGLTFVFGRYLTAGRICFFDEKGVVTDALGLAQSGSRSFTAAQLLDAKNAGSKYIRFPFDKGSTGQILRGENVLWESGNAKSLKELIGDNKGAIEDNDDDITAINIEITKIKNEYIPNVIIGKKNIKENSVTPNRTTLFYNANKNLLNTDIINYGRLTATEIIDGINESYSYRYTDLIPVRPGVDYYVSDKDGNASGSSTTYNWFCDANGEIIDVQTANINLLHTPNTCAYVRLTLRKAAFDNLIQLERGTSRSSYVEGKFTIYGKYLPEELSATPDVVLPSQIFALSGYENSIYHKNYCDKLNNNFYNIDINGITITSKWRYYNRCFRIDKNQAGVTSFNARVYNSVTQAIVGTYSVPTVHSVPTKTNTTKIITIGDSFTYNGIWYKRIADTLTGIELIGTRKSYNCEATQRGEGRGGWSLASYFEPHSDLSVDHMQPMNPFMHVAGYTYYGAVQFWDAVVNGTTKYPGLYTYGTNGFQDYITWFDTNGYKVNPSENDLMYDNVSGKYIKFNGTTWEETSIEDNDFVFDFAKYLSTWNISTPDIVMIMLGTNDFHSINKIDIDEVFGEWTAKMDIVINSIKSYSQSIKIGICTPSVAVEAPNNSDYRSGFIHHCNEFAARKLMFEKYDNDTYKNNGVYVVDTGVCLDPDYGFPVQPMKPFDYYEGAETELFATNGVHPSDAGYKQLGNCAAAFVEWVR